MMRANQKMVSENAWMFPDVKYGALRFMKLMFHYKQRATLNLAYQKLSRVPEKPTCLLEFSAHNLIDLPLKSPLDFDETIYSPPHAYNSNTKALELLPVYPVIHLIIKWLCKI